MKKSVLALAMAFGFSAGFAQDLTSKKGEPYLPEAGDWGIGIDGTSLLSYAKSFIGAGVGASSPSFNFLNSSNNLIMGRYFKDEKTAYRAGLNLGFSNWSYTNNMVVQNVAGTPAAPPAMTSDKVSHSTTGIGLTAGIEKRRGKTRLQGYYGAEAGFWLGSWSDKYTYGNAFSATTNANAPTSTNWATNSDGSINTSTPISGAAGSVVSRNTAVKGGTTFQFGVRGFVGAEYFLFPKMSLGGEFGWGLGFTSVGTSQVTTEAVYGTATTSSTPTFKGTSSTKFNLGTDNNNTMFGLSGSLRFNMYF